MATYTYEVRTEDTHVFTIPSAPPYGAAAAEVGKAWNRAEQKYRELHDLPKDATLADNALTFHPGDEAIIISFVVEKSRT